VCIKKNNDAQTGNEKSCEAGTTGLTVRKFLDERDRRALQRLGKLLSFWNQELAVVLGV
jgi:hypothetical protein